MNQKGDIGEILFRVKKGLFYVILDKLPNTIDGKPKPTAISILQALYGKEGKELIEHLIEHFFPKFHFDQDKIKELIKSLDQKDLDKNVIKDLVQQYLKSKILEVIKQRTGPLGIQILNDIQNAEEFAIKLRKDEIDVTSIKKDIMHFVKTSNGKK